MDLAEVLFGYGFQSAHSLDQMSDLDFLAEFEEATIEHAIASGLLAAETSTEFRHDTLYVEYQRAEDVVVDVLEFLNAHPLVQFCADFRA